MDESTLITHTHNRQIDKFKTLWLSLPASLSLDQRLELLLPLLFLRLASIHADEELAETADICWAELSDSAAAVSAYQRLRLQLCDPHTWAEAAIFSALPLLETAHESSLQMILEWLQELDMYALQYRDIGEFWESCLQQCLAQQPQHASLSPPAALINALVALLQPQPAEHFYDPAAGSGSFLVAAQDYVHMLLEEQDSLPPEHTCQISAQVHSALEQRLCLANLRLHDIPMSDLRIWTCAESQAPESVDIIFANLTTLSDQQTLTRLFQHSLQNLKPNGRALFLLPDDYLAAPQFTAWRRECLQTYQLHTLLRLPQGILTTAGCALFISHTGATEHIWTYDLRSQIPKLSLHSEQLASLLGHFTFAYGEDALPNTPQRELRAAKDARLCLLQINELNDNFDLNIAAQKLNTELPVLLSSTNSPSQQWRGLLNETLQDLHQLDKLLHDENHA